MTKFLFVDRNGKLIVFPDGRASVWDDINGPPNEQPSIKICCPCDDPPRRPPPYPGWDNCDAIELDRAYVWGDVMSGYWYITHDTNWTVACDGGTQPSLFVGTPHFARERVVTYPGFYAPYNSTFVNGFGVTLVGINNVLTSWRVAETGFFSAFSRHCNPTALAQFTWGCMQATVDDSPVGVEAGKYYVLVEGSQYFPDWGSWGLANTPWFRYFDPDGAVGVPGDMLFRAYIPLETGFTNICRVTERLWTGGTLSSSMTTVHRLESCNLVLTRV